MFPPNKQRQATTRERAFSVAAPRTWNSLPKEFSGATFVVFWALDESCSAYPSFLNNLLGLGLFYVLILETLKVLLCCIDVVFNLPPFLKKIYYVSLCYVLIAGGCWFAYCKSPS